MTKIKVCGIRTPADARMCIDAGVHTLGLNFWRGTPRHVDLDLAASIVEAVGSDAELVALFVDAPEDEIRRVREQLGIEWVQLHGAETPAMVERLGPKAYKAIRVGSESVRALAAQYPGERILLDAAVPGGMPGGTGHSFDWALAAEIARDRPLVLAGGLHAGNVAEAIRAVQPYQVDVASGVESAPGVKDAAKVRAFVAAVGG